MQIRNVRRMFVELESMFADNDFCEHARQDGVVIDARHLMFPHRHWLFKASDGEWAETGKGDRQEDDVDRAQNRREAFNVGFDVLAQRRTCSN